MPDSSTPLVVAPDMGYGHMRPATALADALGTEVLQADRAPLADEDEARLWTRTRRTYEATTRWTELPFVGWPLRAMVARFTRIPHLHPYRDLSKPGLSVRMMQRAIRKGLGGGLVARLRETGRPLLTTHFAPAHAADAAKCERIFCVVTDSDIHRIWAPPDPKRTAIRYLVPSMRAERRLLAYGVPNEFIHATGYPLPHALLGGEDLAALKRNFAARLARLDPRRAFRDSYPDELRQFLGTVPEEHERTPPLVTYAVGGAGTQAGIVERFLPGFRPALEAGKIRLALVAGVRPEVAARFRAAIDRNRLGALVGRGIEVLHEPDLRAYFRRFDELLARTDVLWTKPSEITFFGALGIALVLARPVGMHEAFNRRWARECGAAMKQRDPRYAFQWIPEWLEEGLLASAAWSGFLRLPKFGLYRIRKLVLAET